MKGSTRTISQAATGSNNLQIGVVHGPLFQQQLAQCRAVDSLLGEVPPAAAPHLIRMMEAAHIAPTAMLAAVRSGAVRCTGDRVVVNDTAKLVDLCLFSVLMAGLIFLGLFINALLSKAGAAGTYSILVGCGLLLSLLGLLRWLVEGHITGDVLRRHLAESPQG